MKYICSRFFTQVSLNFHSKQITNCCKRLPEKIFEKDIDVLGSNLFQKHPNYIQEKNFMVSQNKLPTGCKVCIDAPEKSFFKVWNLWQNVDFEKEKIDLINDNFVDLIELQLDPICNMSCIYCNSNHSSTWTKILNYKPYVEDKIYKKKMLDALYKFIEEELIPKNKVVEYGFLGGEPLLNLEIFDIIDNIIHLYSKKSENKKIIFSAITNLNVKPVLLKKLIQRIRSNPEIKWILKLSIDALGNIGREQRDGLDLDLWKNNLDILLESKSVNINFLPTISNVSLSELENLFHFIIETMDKHKLLSKYGEKWLIRPNLVFDPVGLYIGTLPEHYKNNMDTLIKLVINRLNTPNKKLIDTLIMIKNNIGTKRTEKDLQEVQIFFDQQSKIKNKNYFDIFTDLKEILK